MAIVKDRQEGLGKLEDLKTLLSGAGPCVSVYFALSNESTAGRNPNAKQNELRWRECLQAAEAQASEFGEEARQLLETLPSWETFIPESNGESRAHLPRSLAVFHSPTFTEVASLDGDVTERAIVGNQFYVRPLVKELVRDRSFYLLALSQKNTRLLHCTMHTSEELPFPEGFTPDFERWMNQTKPDHTAIYNAMAAGGGQGSVRPTALAPKGSDAEDRDEYLSHFAKYIAGGVDHLLKGRSEPLVLCAVDYEIPIYREVNMYPHLVAETVHGAPNGLKAGEMHARAIEALNRSYDARVDEVLADWNHRVGGGASSHIEEVVTAAHDGRVLNLLVSDSQEVPGVFDEATHSARTKGPGPKTDLVNDAVVQTVLHSGKIFIVEQDKMPEGAAVAATFRF